MFIELHTEKDGAAFLLRTEEIRSVTSYEGRTIIKLTFNDEIRLYARESYEEVKSMLLGECYTLDPDWSDGWGSK